MAEPPESDVSSEFPYILHRVNVLGSEMSYIDTKPDAREQNGPTALFLHGNPTSSYLWRNIIPHVSPLMRCVAPDLIGMGQSSKPANFQYRFNDHYTFLSTFIQTVVPSGPLILIAHNWGSGLGLHWAHQQAELSSSRVVGITLMEFLRPFESWDDFGEREEPRKIFQAFRAPEVGRRMIIEENAFVEKVFPNGVVRQLTQEEHDFYRKPFLESADREPTYRWPNQIPIEQRPSDVYDIATRYHNWLLKSDIPKLILWATPGFFVTEKIVQRYQQYMKNLKVVHLGEGRHFLQEDHPAKIGGSIHDWIIGILADPLASRLA